MRTRHLTALLLAAALASPVAVLAAAQEVPSMRVDVAPVIDGLDDDPAWQETKPVAVKDRASGAMILIRSVHTGEALYFSVRFPDNARNPLHKPWLWNAEQRAYDEGPHREDTFVFKWNMAGRPVDLSNFSDDDYTADIWYWKANRTDPAGYADDKTHHLGSQPAKGATELTSATGRTRFLTRSSDAGKAAYTEYTPSAHEGQSVDRYPPATPQGSRADVRAKGRWDNGMWHIEFERRLDTGHDDDVRFDPAGGGSYLFGVSIFSLYGRPHDPDSPNYYGRGRISAPLLLTFR